MIELKILRDEDPINPRTEYDHLGIMMCFHKKYNLGDKEHAGLHPSDFGGWDEMEKELYKRGAVVVLPLYLYDHSGLTMSVEAFHDPFDSGQVGFIYAMRDAVLKEYGLKRNITKKVLGRVTDRLKAEVKEYDQYLRGDVWGYVVENNGEHLDSCWGFYGEEHAREEGEHALHYHQEEARKNPDYEENKLIDQIVASGMTLRATIGGFVDEHKVSEQWLTYLRTLASDLEGQEDDGPS